MTQVSDFHGILFFLFNAKLCYRFFNSRRRNVDNIISFSMI